MEVLSGRRDSENTGSQLLEFQDPQRGNTVAEKDNVVPQHETSVPQPF